MTTILNLSKIVTLARTFAWNSSVKLFCDPLRNPIGHSKFKLTATLTNFKITIFRLLFKINSKITLVFQIGFPDLHHFSKE